MTPHTPMTPRVLTSRTFYKHVVLPGAAFLEVQAGIKSGPEALVLLTAIAGQESGWRHRLQLGGPARSFWQFEKLGGVAEVWQKCPAHLSAVCTSLNIDLTGPTDHIRNTLYEAMAWNDTLACAMARLLLWQDPRPLPAVDNALAGWEYYLRNWRPGAPHPGAWASNHQQALDLVREHAG